jgi:Transposase
MAVMIGIDPHKGSHTAVAVGAAEELLGKIRSVPAQLRPGSWSPGLGRLLGQQLVAAGERVLDVQPKLAARVRLLHTGNTGKSDPNDALSVAVAALRSTANQEVTADNHATVLKVWAKRHRDLSRAYNQVACRLHAVLCELVPGGVPEEITAGRAEKILAQIRLRLAGKLAGEAEAREDRGGAEGRDGGDVGAPQRQDIQGNREVAVPLRVELVGAERQLPISPGRQVPRPVGGPAGISHDLDRAPRPWYQSG